MNLNFPLLVGACITTVVTIAGTVYAAFSPRSSLPVTSQPISVTALASIGHCRTIVNDSQPPLNVRSSPVEQNDNIVAQLKNGQSVTVTNQQGGWIEISSPIVGWVDQALTKTICEKTEAASIKPQMSAANELPAPTSDQGDQVLAGATAAYQAGNLNGAIALIKTIPSSSSAYAKAQTALKTMPIHWKQAQILYHKAEIALKQSKWEVVLKLVDEFPDIRFWREKLAPLVKKAIHLQQGRVFRTQSE